MILELILLFAALLVLIIALLAVCLYLCAVIPYGPLTPPFVPSSKKLTRLIAEELDPAPDSRVYELGAGDMRVSLATWKRVPSARYTGIEKHFFPRMLARWNIGRHRAGKNVSVCEADLYAADLSDATHVYCYLFPEAMQKLHEKFARELPPGTLVVSLDFDIKDKQPERVVDLASYKLRLGKKLYVYRF